MFSPAPAAVSDSDGLRKCVNDLITLITLPFIWADGDLSQIGNTVLNVLRAMLDVDFLFLRLIAAGGESLELTRLSLFEGTLRADQIAKALDASLGNFTEWPRTAQIHLGALTMFITPAPVGLHGVMGVLVAGSREENFPTQEERLILNVAANQVAMAAQEAARLLEQKNLTAVLDELVAQRTAELQSTNEALLREIAERKLAEESRDKFRSELSHVTRVMSLGTMAASIAHEVNQPLSGIITNANTSQLMLSASPPDIVGALETARRTIRDGNRAAAIVDRLSALFKKRSVTVEILDLNDAAREVVALSASDLQRNAINLRADFLTNLPLISADKVQLQQVIMNFLRNAVDSIADHNNGQRKIVVRTFLDDDHRVCLTVEDTGGGIETADADRLFEAFHTTKADGMGIGLSVSKYIVESHNGRIWGIRNIGPGATFGFSIPISMTELSNLPIVNPDVEQRNMEEP
ncbi:signal transduction histidine kinase [Phyllobacterium sp. 1468]|uniref:sensor histidine kinase n=1 Tax=Phyllobacterium sp. 1468 TaxID=2817759 RepID=UPI002858C98B|nr:ATP-binding protein [Phyllobacterium sp. 1468]MDR6635107.1 signal transduction histidine kinase [Phyllobacterium sp. 1468]